RIFEYSSAGPVIAGVGPAIDSGRHLAQTASSGFVSRRATLSSQRRARDEWVVTRTTHVRRTTLHECVPALSPFLIPAIAPRCLCFPGDVLKLARAGTANDATRGHSTLCGRTRRAQRSKSKETR